MIDEAMAGIAAITTRLEKVSYPEQRPELSRISQPLAALFAARLDLLRAPGDNEAAVIFEHDSTTAGKQLKTLCTGVPHEQILWEKDPAEKKDYAIGITQASALIADTASIILELESAAAAYPSLLVDRHFVIASMDQMLPDLQTYYDSLSQRFARELPLLNLVCISGCSRTADIEKMLVVPAHGPRQIRVILCELPIQWRELQTAFDAADSAIEPA
jgi:hypothetical protein